MKPKIQKHTPKNPDDGAETVWHSGRATRLCKAAPDLLMAAKALRSRLLINTLQGSEDAEAVRKANTAIAKAEGE